MARSTSPGDDRVLGLLQKEIEEFRVRSLENFDLDIRVCKAHDAETVLDPSGQFAGYDEYEFTNGSDPPKEILIFWDPEGKGEVRINYLGRPCRLEEYLEQLRPATENEETIRSPESRQYHWNRQSDWWAANGKKFRLLQLPLEVREIIYGYCFGPCVHPYPWSKVRRITNGQKAGLATLPNTKLLMISKQVSREASNILFLQTPFLIEYLGILPRLAACKYTPSRIGRLTLALSHDDFLALFSVKEEGEECDVTTRSYGSSARAIEKMRLNRLELCFSPPSKTTASGVFDGACQRFAVERIIEAAWPIISGHQVELTGFIKKNQRKTLEAAVESERKAFVIWRNQKIAAGLGYDLLVKQWHEESGDEEGGVPLSEIESEIEGELSSEATSITSLKCVCRVRCSRGRWTAED